VLLALVAWIQIGSIDQDTFDDRGLLAELKPVPDAENGFLDIAFLVDEKYSFGDASHEQITAYANGKKWDVEKIDRLIADNAELFDAIKKSNEKSGFMMPKLRGLNMDVFPIWKIAAANRILIIQARRHIQDFEYEKAIQDMEIAMQLAENVRSDASSGILSWQFGVVMQAQIISIVHEIFSNFELSDLCVRRVSKILESVRIENDDFEKHLYGDYENEVSKMFYLNSSSYAERLKYLHDSEDLFDSFGAKVTQKEKIFLFINTMIPDYYVHKNYVADKYSESIRNFTKENIGCPGRQPEESVKTGKIWIFSGIVTDPYWTYFFKPNSLGEGWVSGDRFSFYANRRCAFYVYADAVRAALALKMYKNNHGGALPKKLDMLVPDYLERLPVDYFDGQPLRYSLKNEWLYSVGADREDDGGSKEGIYQGHCHREEACFNSPTIPISAPDLIRYATYSSIK
jgi:hypothetical protein